MDLLKSYFRVQSPRRAGALQQKQHVGPFEMAPLPVRAASNQAAVTVSGGEA